jgi:HAD superfamily hydrolase (TIGR01549 family)
MMAADCTVYDDMNVPLKGREAFKDCHRAYREAFPDLKLTVHDVISEPDRVAIRFTATGTHRRNTLGFPATGKHAGVTGSMRDVTLGEATQDLRQTPSTPPTILAISPVVTHGRTLSVDHASTGPTRERPSLLRVLESGTTRQVHRIRQSLRPTDKALAEVREYQRVTNLWEQVPNFVEPTLRALRGQGLRLGVVSDANGTLRLAFERIGLAPFFDVIVDSAEKGMEKPDPRLFELALRRLGAATDGTFHAGDMYHVDVVGARGAGLSAVLVDEAGVRADVDCQCIRSIAELPAMLGNGRT